MARLFTRIEAHHVRFIENQKLFFVATAAGSIQRKRPLPGLR